MPPIRRRSVWLSHVAPQRVVYDSQDDEFFDSRWLQEERGSNFKELAQRERKLEHEEVERRMTAEGWYDGRQEWLLYDDDDYEERDDGDVFFDVLDEEAISSARYNLEARIPEVMSESDDFHSCRVSLNESIFGSERLNSSDDANDASIAIAAGQLLSSSSSAASGEASEREGSLEEQRIERAVMSAEAKKMMSMGEHIKDTNVFALERLSNRTVTGIVVSYYVTFILLILFGVLFTYLETDRTHQMAIVPNAGDANGTEYVCFPQPDINIPTPYPNASIFSIEETVPCEPDPAISLEQANLLANTIVVSNGIELSNWRGNGAVPGTPPFNAHNITPLSSFIINGTALDYDANPELHAQWDDITAVVWYGNSGSNEPSVGIASATLSLQFVRTDGLSWPHDTPNYAMPIAAGMYACTRGANCTSIGLYHTQLLQPYIINPTQSLSGPNYTISLNIPNSILSIDAIQAFAWRFVLYGDPNGVVSSCLDGEICVINTVIVSSSKSNRIIAILDAILMVSYFFFFAWWLITLIVRSGWPWHWAMEQQWLFIMGVAMSCFNNIYGVGLELANTFSSSFEFNQVHTFVSMCVTQFGLSLQLFCLSLFADGPRRFVSTTVSFYWPKISFCYIFFLAAVIMLLWRLPELNGRDQPGTERTIGGLNFVTTPITWYYHDKVVMAGSAFVLGSMVALGFLYYVLRCVITQRVLKGLPYNMTRPVQIAFNFYVWATSMWVAAEIIMLVVGCIHGIRHGLAYGMDATIIDRVVLGLDDVQFYSKHRNAATVLFGTIFTSIFQLMFSPPSVFGPVKAPRTHYDTEKEAANEEKMKKSKHRIMILERARLLCVCSREAYLPFPDEFEGQEAEAVESGSAGVATNDPVPTSSNIIGATRSNLGDSFLPKGVDRSLEDQVRIAGDGFGIGGPAPTGSSYGMGCRVVAHLSEPKGLNIHDTKAIILRHLSSDALIIAFQGTLTMKQVKTDFMSHKIQVSLDTFLAITSKRERARRDAEGIVPDAIEKSLLKGGRKKVNLLDLLHCHDDKDLPDFLQSSTKRSTKRHALGTCGIHFGFWSSYNRIRREIHTCVYQELLSRPGRLYVCGHSLGGALGTVCAFDMAKWVIPTVQRDLTALGKADDAERITLSAYTYGSPRVGDHTFSHAYNKACKDTQRIVCDGDIITSGPPTWLDYVHVGLENIFDFTGSIRTNPSIVEKSTLRSRTNATSHRLNSYAKVLKLAYQPHMSVLELLNLLREAYGIDEIVEKEEGNKQATALQPPVAQQQQVPPRPQPTPCPKPTSAAFEIALFS